MIPIIDISPLVSLDCNDSNSDSKVVTAELDNVIKSIRDACTTVGFFAITNHGVDTATINNAWKASEEFFDSDTSIKQSVPMTETYPYGYENVEMLGIERNKQCATTDSKETFSIGPADALKSNMPPRKFPSSSGGSSSSINGFEDALTNYYSAMKHLAKVLFRGFAMALKEDMQWFLQEGRFDDGHQCALRILNYPQIRVDDDVNKVHIRAGAHTDYGAMTILKSGGPGLQLQLSKDSTWIDVPHLEDSFIINLGDLMQRWTNDSWKSTLHRVVAVDEGSNRDDGSGGEKVFRSARRQSIAFFVNMNGNATVVPFETCVDSEQPSIYEPIKASEHLMQRHLRSMASKANK